MPADGGDAEVTLTRFAQAGIDRGQLADDLQREGAESFVKSWNELLASIGSEARLKAAS
jgi:transaldolase